MSNIIDRGINAVSSGVQYVQETIAGQTAEAKAEADKQAVKSDQTTLGQKVDSAGSFVSNKLDQKHNEAQAELHKQDAKHS